MISWPAKDPNEVLDFTWSPPLDPGDTLSSFTAVVSGGTVEIDSESNTDTTITLWLSGGTSGETGSISITALTVGGRTFREVALIPVFDRAAEVLAAFRLRYAAFSGVSDGVVSYWLADAVSNVGSNWPDDAIEPARLAYAAHMLAEQGLGTNASAQGVTALKSGTFSASVSEKQANRTSFNATIYGREYLRLARRNFGTPVLAWTP